MPHVRGTPPLSVPFSSEGHHHRLGRWHDECRKNAPASHPALALSVARDEEREDALQRCLGSEGERLLPAHQCRCFRNLRGGETLVPSWDRTNTKQPRYSVRLSTEVYWFAPHLRRPLVLSHPGRRAVPTVSGRHAGKPGRTSCVTPRAHREKFSSPTNCSSEPWTFECARLRTPRVFGKYARSIFPRGSFPDLGLFHRAEGLDKYGSNCCPSVPSMTGTTGSGHAATSRRP